MRHPLNTAAEEENHYGDTGNQWRIEGESRQTVRRMSSGDTVREQFSALQKQQKERLGQLQEKSAKKKPSTADVRFTCPFG